MTDFSYQLYSSRKFPPLDDTLKMLAELGYSQVEGYGALYKPGDDVGALRAKLDEHGLSMPTGHVALDAMESDPEGVIGMVRTLGMNTVFAPHVAADARPSDAAGWADFGKRLGEAAKPLLDAGLKVGWHNHDFEMMKAGEDYVLDLILDGSDDLSLELDLAWVKVGGEEPVDWVVRHAHRLVSVHLKDIAPVGQATDEDGWADVGHGTMNWPAIWTAVRDTGCRYFVMEHDNPNDHARFARRSIEAARGF